MLPRIGVYEYDADLHEALMEGFHAVSNRQLLYHLITQPLYDIRKQFSDGVGNPYILRERHRKWCEYLREHMGEWLDLPSWGELVEGEDTGCCFHGMDDCLCDLLFSDGEEWVLFGDDVDLAYDLIDRLHIPLLLTDDVEDVIDKILETNPDVSDLIVLAHNTGTIYVIRSTKVEHCGAYAPGDTLAFNHIASGEAVGDLPTYVLDDETVEAYADLVRATAEYESRERTAC